MTTLLVTDEGAGPPRTTLDVDAIAEISSYAEYSAFGERLRALGFSEDTSEDAPLCRWVHSGTILDVMPWMSRFWDSLIGGIAPRWKPQPRTSAIDGRSTIVDEVQNGGALASRVTTHRNRRIAGGAGIHRRPSWVLVARCRESGKDRGGPTAIESVGFSLIPGPPRSAFPASAPCLKT